MFDLKSPCSNCPFRKGIGEIFQLGKERLEEIKNSTAFQCHKTIDYSEFDDPEKRQGDNPQQCAGLIATLRNSGSPNSIMQVAQRIGGVDFSEFDPRNEAYGSWIEAIKAHE